MSNLIEPGLVGRVKEIHRFPVKSMVGEQLPRTTLSRMGVPKDRIWAIRDLDMREITSAKRLPSLLQCRARVLDENSDHVEIVLPSGRTITSEQGDASQALSAELKRNLVLEPLAPASNRQHYRIGQFRGPRALRQIFGVRKGGPLPDMSVLPLSMLMTLALYATPPGTYFDVFPLHIVTTSALSALSRSIGEDAVSERFRPNLVIDTEASDESYPERSWKGALHIGQAALQLQGATVRCGMPSHAQAMGIAKAPAVVRTIYGDLDSKFGIYASVRGGGDIAIGDRVFLSPLPRSAMKSAWDTIGDSLKRCVFKTYLGLGRGR
jgi:uncharacterized protein